MQPLEAEITSSDLSAFENVNWVELELLGENILYKFKTQDLITDIENIDSYHAKLSQQNKRNSCTSRKMISIRLWGL